MALDVRVLLKANAAAFTQGIKNAGGSLQQFQKRLDNMGRQMKDIGQGFSLFVSAPVAGLGALTLRTAGNFEQGMNRVRAITQASGKDIERLREQAKELGRTTQFSASQAADAMGFLAQAGNDADQILAAMPQTLELAAAAQIDLGSAADTVTNILSGYGREVSQLAQSNDVLVATTTKTNTDLQQLGQAMKFAGPVASAAGIDFEESAAALGLMGNAGIQASMAGTSLRGAITRILNPTSQSAAAMRNLGIELTDSEGRVKSLTEIVRELEPHADDAGNFMLLFGQRAGPAMAALVQQGSDKLASLTEELQNSAGITAANAAVQMEGFNGAVRELSSAFEGLQIALAESGMIDFVADLARGLSETIRRLTEADPALLKFATVIGAVAASAGPVVLGLGAIATGIAALLTPVGLVVAAIVGAAGLIATFWALRDEAAEAVQSLKELVSQRITGMITAIRTTFTGFTEWWREFWELFGELTIEVVSAPFDFITDKVNAVTEGVAGAFGWLKDTLVGNSIIPDMMTDMVKVFGQGLTAMERASAGTGRITAANFQRMAESSVDFFGFMAGSMVQIGKQLFGESKILNIALAIADTARGVTLALSTIPPPAGWAAAATTAAMGAAQIATISSTSIGGGGTITRGTSAGSMSLGATPSPASAITGGITTPEPPETGGFDDDDDQASGERVIRVQLESQRNIFTREDIDNLLEQLNDALADGATLRVS